MCHFSMMIGMGLACSMLSNRQMNYKLDWKIGKIRNIGQTLFLQASKGSIGIDSVNERRIYTNRRDIRVINV